MRAAALDPTRGALAALAVSATMAWQPGAANGVQEPRRGARVERSWTLEPEDGQNAGILGSFVRCGDEAYVSDVRRLRIRRLDLASAKTLPGWDVAVPPFALGADCAGGRLFVAGGGGRKMVALALDRMSGTVVREYALPPSLFPQGGLHADAGQLMVGGLRMSDTPAVGGAAEDAASFYRGLSIAARVDRESATVTTGFEPFESACHASAGQCVRATFARAAGIAGVAWLVTQPTSSRIGLYDDTRRLVRTLAIASPGFRRNGARVALSAGAEEGLRWGAANSLVHAAYAVNGTIAVVHYRFDLPDGWTFGQQVQFKAALNVYHADGRVFAADEPLPELTIGQDDTHLYVADYGPGRRGGDHDRMSILRVAVPAAPR